jgi:hypothetical protein
MNNDAYRYHYNRRVIGIMLPVICLAKKPNKSYIILGKEQNLEVPGSVSIPGIRSDSDMYTLFL